MSSIAFFWPRAWICLSGFAISIFLVFMTRTHPSCEASVAIVPDWFRTWMPGGVWPTFKRSNAIQPKPAEDPKEYVIGGIVEPTQHHL